jgi:cytochrome c biogenesis protein CcmG, thiol:disulfide interchange protein DsbE
MRIVKALPLIILLLLAVVLAVGGQRQTPPSPLVGTKIPSFGAPALDKNGAVFSPDRWKGKVVLLNVFASWCLPCAAEHETLMRLAKSGKVEIVGLAWRDEPERITKWLAERGNPYKLVGIDAKGENTVELGLTGVPETFVIGRDGVIAWHYKSNLTDDIVEKTILPIIDRLQHAPVP